MTHAGLGLAFGEVRTALLQNSRPLSADRAAEILDLVAGERVRRIHRPIDRAISADRWEGVDCRLPSSRGAHTRGVGTLASHAIVTGGHVAQGSTHADLIAAPSTRRQPWSHYLATPGRLEIIGKYRPDEIAGGLLRDGTDPGVLDVGAIADRGLDIVQRDARLDHLPPLRAPRTAFRWVAYLGAETLTGAYTIESERLRTLRLTVPGQELPAVVRLCEDLALHDWLLTALTAIVEAALTGDHDQAERVRRLRPAIEHLAHLWMPGAQVDEELMPVWTALNRRPGFDRQWTATVTRVRDLLTLTAARDRVSRPPGDD
ncbi:hypothetical protein GCM10010168_90550 [Actinoplanes ianthinogenes]|uniref:Serine protease n=1 Tax=Actinoplanes ianthinogenes TaxID=122358 RepID=A0ABM7LST5_9ACTN|nr:SCO2521 family protein [Actinoplanes ianthinogenes]BCJ42330.1 hypothetical protein Aiant_29870 [Actinoplanes ianthinogenes]GGR57581.1 hypothetical protein GCM10010168_90550 [Actinoplanes ianthinogenes]